MAIGDRNPHGGGPGSHPLAGESALRAFLDALPQTEPAALFHRVCSALEGAPAQGLAPGDFARALRLLDERAQIAVTAVTRSMLNDARGAQVSDVMLAWLMRYFQRIGALYARVVDGAAGGKAPPEVRDWIPLFASRNLYALAQRKKLARIAYRQPERDLWRALHAWHAHHIDSTRTVQKTLIYPTQPAATSAQDEYLVALMLETVPLSGFTPAQIECLDLLLRRFAQDFLYRDKPWDTGCFFVDPEHSPLPQRWLPGLPTRSDARFFGPGELLRGLSTLSDEARRAFGLPDWAAQSGCDGKAYLDLIVALGKHWSEAPPQRREQRNQQSGEVQVVYGLNATCSVLRTAARPEAERRRQEEPAAEFAALSDLSDQGLGLVLPPEARITSIGELLACRLTEGTQWELAIIRRLQRTGMGQLVGLERIQGRCSVVRMEPASAPTSHFAPAPPVKAVEVILVIGTRNLLIVPPGVIATGMTLLVNTAAGSRSYRAGEVSESGVDFNLLPLQPE